LSTYGGLVAAGCIKDFLPVSWQDRDVTKPLDVIKVFSHKPLELLVTVKACHLESLHINLKAQRLQKLLCMAVPTPGVTAADATMLTYMQIKKHAAFPNEHLHSVQMFNCRHADM